MLGVQAHEGHRGFDRLLSRLEFEYSVAADDFFGLGVRPVDHGELPAGAAHSYAAGAGAQAAGLHQRTVLERVGDELGHGVLQSLRRRSLVLG